MVDDELMCAADLLECKVELVADAEIIGDGSVLVYSAITSGARKGGVPARFDRSESSKRIGSFGSSSAT